MVQAGDLDSALGRIGLPPAKALFPLDGGTGDVYRVVLEDGSSVVFKSFKGKKVPPRLDAFAAGLAENIGTPVSK